MINERKVYLHITFKNNFADKIPICIQKFDQ